MVEHGLRSAQTQYRLYGRPFFTGQKTQPTVSEACAINSNAQALRCWPAAIGLLPMFH